MIKVLEKIKDGTKTMIVRVVRLEEKYLTAGFFKGSAVFYEKGTAKITESSSKSCSKLCKII